MATAADYFATDFTLSFYLGREYRLKSIAGEEHTLKYRLLSDFTSNAKYLAFYFPAELVDARLFFTLLDEHAKFLAAPKTNVTLGRYGPVGLQAEVDTSAKSGAKLGVLWPGDLRHLKEDDLPFTGRIYFYSENDAPPDVLEKLYEYAEAKGLSVIWRGRSYAAKRSAFDSPRAFISHDSRDKDAIARSIAMRLRSMLCPVWFDEFSLKVGDSLRESIESGLKVCPMCIFVLTLNFLAKGGWPKREYEIIFTRELVEEKKLILPVWAGVSRDEVYQYSPILADRVAVDWALGEEEFCRRLFGKLIAAS